MNNECGNSHVLSTTKEAVYCNLHKGHAGDHAFMVWAYYGLRPKYCWPQKPLSREWTAPEKQYTVQLTLEELKSVVYALSGEEWLEDQPELVKKFDKALKGAL